MEHTSFYTRNVFNQYNKQLVATRTVAHHRRIMNMVSGEEPQLSPAAKRAVMINRVAREVFTNLLVTGSENPMICEVRAALRREFGEDLEFQYPPGSLDLLILRKTAEGLKEVSQYEHADITSRAWSVTLSIVDSYVL